MNKKNLLLILILVYSVNSNAQEIFKCGLPYQTQKQLLKHPEIVKTENDLEEFTQHYIKQNEGKNYRSTAYIIPVVFHIIHNYGAENISDAQVYDAIRVMNADYSKKNYDTINTIDLFKPIAADCQIEFRLARKDPDGNCTNGIDRIQSQETYIGDEGSKLNGWPRNMYLNIWVVAALADGAAAYSYTPGSAQSLPNGDGIICIEYYVGSIGTSNAQRSHTLSHEAGHWMNLKHPWGNTNSPGVTCGDDYVTDTPPTKGWNTCNLSGISCGAGIENVQNFMDYSYCSTMFTAGQKARMQAALNSGTAQRNNIWSLNNLVATGTDLLGYDYCAPLPEIMPHNTLYVCAGDTLSFTGNSVSGPISSWSWNFNGGTPNFSTDSIPKIIYNTPGTYSVTLAASNNIGSNTITTQNNYVVVLPATSQYSATDLSESFETGTFPNALWAVNNSNGISWTKTTSSGYTGTSCLKLNNASNITGSINEFISATYDFSALSSPTLYFRMAFAKKLASGSDALKVFVSIDCGKTWKLKYSKSGNGLATVAINTGTFTPSSQADWRLEKVNLSAYTGITNVRFKFQFNYQSGNNLYIDDINFGQLLGVNENLNRAISFSVFPNPATGNRFGVSFNLEENNAVVISLINVEGKSIELLNQTLQAGHQLLYFNPAAVSKGIYFIRIEDEKNNSYTQQIILD